MVVVQGKQQASVAGVAIRPQGQRTGRRADQLLRMRAWGFSAGSRRPVRRLCSCLGKRRQLK